MGGCQKTPTFIEPTQITQHGQARGDEPVQNVENIRGYYDLLIWLTKENRIKKNAMETEKIVEEKHTAEAVPTAFVLKTP